MAIVHIDDLGDARLDPYLRLTNHQLRNRLEESEGMLICESAIAIDVALRSGVEPLSLLVDEQRLAGIRDLLDEWPQDCDVYVLPHGASERITGYNVYRGVLAAMRRPRPLGMRELLDQAESGAAGTSRIAVLEGLVDVSNVGAAFRSAAALDVDGLVLAPTCADPWNRRSVRVSMGTVFQVPWARAEGEWPQGLMGELARRGYESVALALRDDALPLDDERLKRHPRLALFFGTEGTGLTRPVLDACDVTAIIPMSHGVDSLNVAASSAVVFWELCHKR